MRIISGSHRSRQIKTPPNLPVRPTTDMAKEALFNILVNNFDLEEIFVLDLFAGTGNISYEFASRGALGVTSIDTELRCVDFIRTTARELNFEALLAFRSDAFKYIQNCTNKYDIIFCDPPYAMEGIETLPGLILDKGLLKPEGWLIVEHPGKINFSTTRGFLQHRKYGNVNFSIFTMPDLAEEV